MDEIRALRRAGDKIVEPVVISSNPEIDINSLSAALILFFWAIIAFFLIVAFFSGFSSVQQQGRAIIERFGQRFLGGWNHDSVRRPGVPREECV